MAESNCPIHPSNPINCVIIAFRFGGNHAVVTRKTEMNVMASPKPTTARPRIAMG